MTRRLIDALRCQIGLPRYVMHVEDGFKIRVCAHCWERAGSSLDGR